MKKLLASLFLFTFVFASVPAFATITPVIRVTPPAPKFTDAERHAELGKRRAAVAARMTDKSMLILFSAEPKLYTNDVDYVYRQENNLYYLTGLKQDGATLVLTKDGATVREILFLPKRVPQREAWEGKMYSREQATQISGLTTIIDSSDRDAFLKAVREKGAFTSKDGRVTIAAGVEKVYMLLPRTDADTNGLREYAAEAAFTKEPTEQKIENARFIFDDLRHIKSAYEIKMLQHAIDITTEAQMRAMGMVGKAKWEYEVHAEVEYTFRRRNADFWGYPSIVGCGANATTLHYVESQSPVKKGELLLMDVGAEYEHYTADVTRTFPVSGKFTKEQAEIYRIVYDAQEAVAKATKPGVTFQALQAIARDTIADGLLKLGLITKKAQVGMWFIHGLGHWLGMNVHDVGRYGVPLQAGMVFTNEPGIYIREDTLDNMADTPENKLLIAAIKPAFEKYKNIGVRIEDDMLVTATGVEWLTKDLPRKLEDVESFMAQASKEMEYRSQVLAPGSIFTSAYFQVGATTRRGFVRTGTHLAMSESYHHPTAGSE
ncbi:MAG TPA: aminopeptidase P family protein [Pyrinomonadaceae bacterium]|nr:aminopeptidase P family protein [Pyrinomonadaceae bacterium]